MIRVPLTGAAEIRPVCRIPCKKRSADRRALVAGSRAKHKKAESCGLTVRNRPSKLEKLCQAPQGGPEESGSNSVCVCSLRTQQGV